MTLSASTVMAQQDAPGAFAYLRFEPSVRVATLGGPHNALPGDDPTLFYANPALVQQGGRNRVGFSITRLVADQSAGAVAYHQQVRGIDAAAGIRYLSHGELVAADALGERTGTFSAYGLGASLAAAHNVTQRIRLGVGTTFHVSAIEAYRASALSLEAGAVYHHVEERFAMGLSVHQAGVTLNSLGTEKDNLPLDVRLGVSKRLAYLPLLISVTGYRLNTPGAGMPDRSTGEQILAHLAIGGELQFSQAFQVRVGFNPRRNQELRTGTRLDPAGISTGFGMRVGRLTLDYGYASWSGNGGVHQMGVRLR